MNIRKILGLTAVAGLMLVASPMDRAQAVSLSNPAVAGTAKFVSEGFTTEVRGGRGGHRGGGHHGGHRHYGFRHRAYVPRSYHGPRVRCRMVVTNVGPRRVCRRWW